MKPRTTLGFAASTLIEAAQDISLDASIPVQALEPESQSVYAHYDSVDRLFAAIRRALSFGQFKIPVQYHEESGYPVVADLDPRREVTDGKLRLRVTGFKPIGGTRVEPGRFDGLSR